MSDRPESTEERIARYLDNAGLALACAATARSQDTRRDYVAIATSWMKLAERAFDQSKD